MNWRKAISYWLKPVYFYFFFIRLQYKISTFFFSHHLVSILEVITFGSNYSPESDCEVYPVFVSPAQLPEIAGST